MNGHNGSSSEEGLSHRDGHGTVVRVPPWSRVFGALAQEPLQSARGRAFQRISKGIANNRSDKYPTHPVTKRDVRNHGVAFLTYQASAAGAARLLQAVS